MEIYVKPCWQEFLRMTHEPRLFVEMASGPRFWVQNICWIALWAVMWQVIGSVSMFFCDLFIPSVRKLKWVERKEWRSRMISTVSAVAHSGMSFYLLCTHWQLFNWGPAALWEEPILQLFARMTCGYFIEDLTEMLVFHDTPLYATSSVIHHAYSAFAEALPLYTHVFYCFSMQYGLTELSTPSINLRWFLHTLDRKSSLAYTINGGLMWLLFLVVRLSFIIWTPLHYRHQWQLNTSVPIISNIALWTAYTLLSILNTYWFALITRGLLKVLLPAKGPKAAEPKAE